MRADTQNDSHFADIGGHDLSGRPGYSIIFHNADPTTDPVRVARWAIRARQEGVI